MAGTLYVVATPIGNRGDMVPRALEILQNVGVIAAEDTRRSRRLLNHFGIDARLVSYHDHSDDTRSQALLGTLERGDDVALISDAGTPLISDPGFRLVRECQARGYRVSPVPGPCAAVAALSVAGLPSDRFVFEGFLPTRQARRLKLLEGLLDESRTMIFYEAPHRIVETLEDMIAVFGGDRHATLARELTKVYETVIPASLESLHRQVCDDANQQRGEIALVVAGIEQAADVGDGEKKRVLTILLEEMPPNKAAAMAAKLTGGKRNDLYRLALQLGE